MQTEIYSAGRNGRSGPSGEGTHQRRDAGGGGGNTSVVRVVSSKTTEK